MVGDIGDERRVGELRGHQLAQGEQCQLESLEEERQANQHIDESRQNTTEPGDRLAQYQQLKAEDRQCDRQDIGDRVQQGVQQLGERTG